MSPCPKCEAEPERIASRELRDKLGHVLGFVQETKERVIVTIRGKPVAAIVPVEDLDNMSEVRPAKRVDPGDLEVLRKHLQGDKA